MHTRTCVLLFSVRVNSSFSMHTCVYVYIYIRICTQCFNRVRAVIHKEFTLVNTNAPQAHSPDHATRTRVEVATARVMLQHSAYSSTMHACEDNTTIASQSPAQAHRGDDDDHDKKLLERLLTSSARRVRLRVCGLFS